MPKPFLKMLWPFLLAGFGVPCLLLSIIFISGLRVEGALVWMLLIPWPTFPLMMSAEAGGGEFLAFLISALANAAVYGVAGCGVIVFYRRFFRRSD